MSLLTVWTILFVLLLCLNIFWVVSKNDLKDNTLKNALVLSYLIVAQISFYLPEVIYQASWTLNKLGFMWGWSIGNQQLLLITMAFATGIYSKNRSLKPLLLSGLASAVVLSTYHYQAALLFALMGYLFIERNGKSRKSLVYPTALLSFISFETLWAKSEVLSLAEYISGSALEILICCLVLMFIYHIINLLSGKQELGAVDLILVTVSQYVTTFVLSEYLAISLVGTALVIMSIVWTIVLILGLSSKSQSLSPGLGISLLIIQFSIFGLLPDESNISYFVILILGFLEMHTRDQEKRDLAPGFHQVERVYTRSMKAIAPVSWVGLWPVYLLVEKTGLELYAAVSLCLSVLFYGLVVIARTDFQIKLDDLKSYKHGHLLTLLKLVAFFGLMSFPIKKMLVNMGGLGFNEFIVSPASWIFILAWLLMLSQKLYLKEDSAIHGYFSKMKTSLPTQTLVSVSTMIESLRDSVIHLIMNSMRILYTLSQLAWDGIKNIMMIVADAISKLLSGLLVKQELISLLIISAFFMFYIWRYST